MKVTVMYYGQVLRTLDVDDTSINPFIEGVRYNSRNVLLLQTCHPDFVFIEADAKALLRGTLRLSDVTTVAPTAKEFAALMKEELRAFSRATIKERRP